MGPPSLRVGVIGAGRVGAVLAAALRKAGHEVVAASGVSDASRERAEALLPAVPLLQPQEVAQRADLLLLTVPDDELAPLVAGLDFPGALGARIVVHTSGAQGLAVLSPVVEAGGVPLAIHPAMTFSGTDADLPRLSGCPFAVTAMPDHRMVADALVLDIGGEPFTLDEADRTQYHAALAHGSNHLVTLVAQAAELLRRIDVDDPGRLLRPLLEAALDNALERGDKALTGPVARGDAGTLTRHLAMLDALAADGVAGDIPPTYRALALATARRAGSRGALTPIQIDAVLGVLEPPGVAGPSDTTEPPAPGEPR
ncbi:Rossmann-like and DUF2520 domain-containing protein [Dermacoccus abyssi]|uniref:Rossmann-like and DUF2520 domain-containing protein n=1 Tax=Dermacoccus abyssi TaxID=322596 RepID=UPI002AD38D14|nr:DUF2520 domain-containing protein [Dermacoccus abyssi]